MKLFSLPSPLPLPSLLSLLPLPPPPPPSPSLLPPPPPSSPSQCQYELLPPSLARFSPSDPDTVIYAGYGMERCVQFYSLSQKAVVRTAALTHWATAMDVSPQGHLLAFGCKGDEFIGWYHDVYCYRLFTQIFSQQWRENIWA